VVSARHLASLLARPLAELLISSARILRSEMKNAAETGGIFDEISAKIGRK